MALRSRHGRLEHHRRRGLGGKYYLYEVEVYAPEHGPGREQPGHRSVLALSLATNSARSQIVDLGDPALMPEGWDATGKPPLAAPGGHHASTSSTCATSAPTTRPCRTTSRAPTWPSRCETTDGMQHLKALADAGLTHVHLLPAFDIATIDEDRADWQAPDPAMLATYPPDSDQQQAAVTATERPRRLQLGLRPVPLHRCRRAATPPIPTARTRIVEFREMVQALNETGLRVVMDVVYNHTNAAGQSEKSVLDRIVPGYYHRLDDRRRRRDAAPAARTRPPSTP